MMRKVLLSVISLFAVTTAVVSAFTPVVKPIRSTLVVTTTEAPRDRRATIVNDGKANGKRIEIRRVFEFGTTLVLFSL